MKIAPLNVLALEALRDGALYHIQLLGLLNSQIRPELALRRFNTLHNRANQSRQPLTAQIAAGCYECLYSALWGHRRGGYVDKDKADGRLRWWLTDKGRARIDSPEHQEQLKMVRTQGWTKSFPRQR